ncbi:Dyp-type peroxidase [Fomitiporia mediterranea MF3/22]|uniref:Dyp-type peroxidase n=1 Tax=Fomitiporia mediterranea (strain MF3/22) TaxID=694068 RepID=UPI0004409C40|nr:Dyp-type peroxidase [Fomitiporia mediterranea MF3/22]EJD06642.1 Dyp-type peroxidase [Fomitiporia mediterranea MF3/22]
MATPTWPTPQDLNDLQADVVLGIPKRAEDFIFFNIQDAAAFKKDLKELIPAITTTAQVKKIRTDITNHKQQGKTDLIKVAAINIAFSVAGLKKLGITESLGDDAFNQGQLAHAQNLGDTGKTENGSFVPEWIDAFKNEIDGVVLVAGDSKISVDEGVNKVEHTFGKSIKEVFKVNGHVRPNKEKGHEHFGFKDGISFPAIDALTGHLPGQIVVDPGVLVCGTNGDTVQNRPAWAKNGSFLVYRQLQQLVPEFNKFLTDNPVNVPGLPRDKGSELLGARLFGRWKSGAPIELAPTADDPKLAEDKQRNNNFDFKDSFSDQTKCPFAAHIRKTNPRNDLIQPFGDGALKPHMIVRQSITYGPEVTPEEAHSNKTKVDRGLAFVCYQSNLANGFEFVQESWANATGFPPQKPVTPGFDPIIGQKNGQARETAGLQIDNQSANTTLPIEFVVSKGGAYFFSPSITALKTKLSA